VSAGHSRTIGGASETDVTELAAIPTGPSGPCAVMTVTPVGRWPRVRRNSSLLNVISARDMTGRSPRSTAPKGRPALELDGAGIPHPPAAPFRTGEAFSPPPLA